MPKINKSTTKLTIIKPTLLGMGIGDTAKITITGSHLDNNGLISAPATAEYKKNVVEGHFPINTSNFRKIAEKFGDDSDEYIGVRFIAVAIPRNNPNTSQEVLGWAIKDDSIEK